MTRSGVSVALPGEHARRMDQSIRVALVNDYELVLEGLRALLMPYAPGIRVVELDVRTTPVRSVDVTLFDTYGEAGAVRERVQELAADAGNGAVVVFSFSNSAVLSSGVMSAGAQGFISKASPAAQIVDGICKAARGERVMSLKRSQRATMIPELGWPGRAVKLTERESELLALLPTGMTNRQLGGHLFLSANTIKSQLRSLFSKLGVTNRVQAVALARGDILGHRRKRGPETNGREPQHVEGPA
jgi:DNA-binding NarL/FixJ family response regulator